MAKLKNVAVGGSVYLNVNGTKKEFIVIHQGLPSTKYDSSCDGTWVLMKDCYSSRKWHSSSSNSYAASSMHTYLDGTFVGLLDSDIQGALEPVKIPYTNGTGSGGSLAQGANGLSAKVFLLSYTEAGLSGSSYRNIEGTTLSYFNGAENSKRIAYYSGTARSWWTRSPRNDDTSSVFVVNTSGAYGGTTCTGSNYVRPALILGDAFDVDESNNVIRQVPFIGGANIGGSQVEFTAGYAKVGGEWLELSAAYSKIGGEWTE